jgi:uncharacterized protein
LLDEPARRDVDDLWREAASVFMADVGYVELRSALAAAHRAHRLSFRALASAKQGLEERWEMLEVLATDPLLVRAAGELAEARKLRALDALHLAAALSLEDRQLVVVTCDRRLWEAARGAGLPVAPA